jgi:hypothetical protein
LKVVIASLLIALPAAAQPVASQLFNDMDCDLLGRSAPDAQ